MKDKVTGRFLTVKWRKRRRQCKFRPAKYPRDTRHRGSRDRQGEYQGGRSTCRVDWCSTWAIRWQAVRCDDGRTWVKWWLWFAYELYESKMITSFYISRTHITLIATSINPTVLASSLALSSSLSPACLMTLGCSHGRLAHLSSASSCL